MLAPQPHRIQDKLDKFTSDHAWQTITVKDTGPTRKKTILNGFTWNLLNKGHAKGLTDYSNNPFNIEETEADYVQRKSQQFQEIIAIIRDRQASRQPLDFMLFQEVNAFTNGELLGFPAKKGPPALPAKPAIAGLNVVVDEFKRQLDELGWGCELSNPNITHSKPLVTLYNKGTLRLNGAARGILMGPKGKNTGFELPFEHIPTQRRVAITNLHLEYTHDHSEDILRYQFDQIRKGIFTVMGGDLNHPPNYKLVGKIGNYKYVTNIDEDPANPTSLSDADQRTRSKFKKHYDGFLCSPGGANNRVSAQETKGKCFEIVNGSVKVREYDPKIEYRKNAKHVAPIAGVPWIKHKKIRRLLPYLSPEATQAIAPLLSKLPPPRVYLPSAQNMAKPAAKPAAANPVAQTRQRPFH
jgi:hypothetical protein